ncbi:MAE_28990/MAE_18760 family HEPN-like nuclease [Dolichospermum circinale]|uniref:MAE_28990/MAE_18760 family HEPN-like nuclease n=1 Tax=Dolichospermum circinale TaxID=109265 RepID=UPI00232BCC54|nr:MAE_28990/MAE_18760 family HEPN-like nuclease [Dolichospermum circinale]MDB9458010.1 MAE_28990/MAE_18760 family HEPN-like nuclease [Dolichospermum circinale CS-545/17]MDB9468844.1 MAE_28990/MAE_18760 family HEPN-like nuclease [Dolichospermum circinale CS-539/09]MDB9471161.1 MAE_28990/MAE_18760 family HEPN-like nuclease [Dolichospermum circinale CS-539]
MNIESLERFKKELNQIREYLKHIQYVNDVAAYHVQDNDNEQIKNLLNTLSSHDRGFRTDRRIFEYKASIISLYGLIEKYVEIWIKEYLDFLSSVIPKYTQIHEKIRENHFELSLKLINTITTRESAKYQRLTKEEVLNKLNNCIVNPSKYQINTDAFVLLSGNLKHNKIVELFNKLNLDLNDELLKNEELKNEIGLTPERISRIEKDILYKKINDLVERRNEIAHGSEKSTEEDNLLQISELEPYIQFLEKYCQAIFQTLFEQVIKEESRHTFQKIENVINTYDNKILAFELENYTIKVGDILIVETKEGRFYKKPILTIELNNKSYQELTVLEKTNIGVSVEPKIKDNQTFYIIKK